MTADQARSLYRRTLKDVVYLRRYTGTGTNRPRQDTEVRARVTGYQPHELIAGSGLQQGDRKVILLAEDLVAAQVTPPVKGDRIVIGGVEANIQAVDDNTRRIGSELIAYEIAVRG